MDELSPLFHDIEFNERFRGYDVEEVDAYVDRVAKAAALVQGRIAELQDRVAAAEAQPRTVVASAAPAEGELDDGQLSRVLVLAQRTADAAIEEANAEAEALRTDAHADAARVRRDADDHASLVLAEAETDRRRIIAEAEETAAGAIAAERARVAAEVAELERHRAFLADDISILEQHLADTRLSVAASLSTLTDLLEAPESFRPPAMPQTSGVEVPAGLVEGRVAAASDPEAEIEESPGHVAEPLAAELADVETAELADAAADVETVELADGAADVETVELADAVPGAPFESVDDPFAPPIEAEAANDTDPTVLADDAFALEPADVPSADVGSSLRFDPSEPTAAFDALSFDHDPEPDGEPVPFEAAAGVEAVPVDAAPVGLDQAATEVDHTAADEHESIVSAEDSVFDIDLLDDQTDVTPVVDLTEPVVALGESGDDTATVEGAGSGPVGPEGDSMTATAPPRLVTAADFESGEAGEWIDGLRDAAAPVDETTGELLFPPPESTANDHFLDQLRDAVTADEPEEFADDALAAFFDEGDDADGRGWFNRRR